MGRKNNSGGPFAFAVVVVLFALLASVTIVPMVGTADGATESTSSRSRLNVVSTISILQDFVEQIGGDRVSCISLVTGNENPHTYATTTADRIAIENASVFVEIGGDAGPELEPWAQDLLDSSDNKDLIVCEAAKNISLVDGNPHVWMDPENAKIMVKEIASSLMKADPDGADIYRSGMENYIQRINQTENHILQEIAPHNGTKVIASHPAFLYFFNFIGFKQVDLLVDVPGQEPSSQHVSQIIDEIKEQNISLIVTMPQFPTPVIEQIQEDTGVKSVEITALIGPLNTTTYLGMLEYDTQAIISTLSGSTSENSHSTPAIVYVSGLAGITAIALLAVLIYRRQRRREE